MKEFDVIVVGHGPAGASVAGHLAGAGFSTLVIDENYFPREKVCSDALTGLALHHLRTMGISVDSDGRYIKGIKLLRKTKEIEYRYFH